MSSPEPEMVPRAAVSCDQCRESAVVKLPIWATRAEVQAAAIAIHARMSPKCKVLTLSIKWLDLPLN